MRATLKILYLILNLHEKYLLNGSTLALFSNELLLINFLIIIIIFRPDNRLDLLIPIPFNFPLGPLALPIHGLLVIPNRNINIF